MPDIKCIYHNKSFKAVKKHLSTINLVSKILNISPQSIFGAMVEEHHDYSDKRLANVLLDLNVIALTRYNHATVVKYFSKVKNSDKIFSIKDKIKNPILNDISAYNIKIATAINLLKNYYTQSEFYTDPLNLNKYKDNYGLLVKDMLSENEVIPKIAGLMILEAKLYFEARVDKAWWENKNQNYKDALYITYYNMGKKTIDERYQECLHLLLLHLYHQPAYLL